MINPTFHHYGKMARPFKVMPFNEQRTKCMGGEGLKLILWIFTYYYF